MEFNEFKHACYGISIETLGNNTICFYDGLLLEGKILLNIDLKGVLKNIIKNSSYLTRSYRKIPKNCQSSLSYSLDYSLFNFKKKIGWNLDCFLL